MTAFFSELLSRFRAFLRPRAADRDFDQEIADHLAMAEAEHRQRGCPPEEARRRARVELGGLVQLRESQREARAIPFVGGLGLDLKLGIRMLSRSWGLTLVGGASMAVVMGFGAAMLAVLDTVKGSAFPVNEGDRIVAIQPYDPVERDDFDTPFDVYLRWRDNLESFEELGAVRTNLVEFVPNAFSRPIRVAEITPSVFRALGIGPRLGRFLAADDTDRAEPVVVLGYDAWRDWFLEDNGVVGQRVELGGIPRRVIGVMPDGFGFPVNEQAWIPFPDDVRADGAPRNVTVIGRLAAGVPLAEADAEVAALGVIEFPDPPAGELSEPGILRTRVVPYASTFNDDFRDNPWLDRIALTLVFLLLVPPAANIGILLYARNVSRREEFAARYALGAGRGRIVVQLFVEAVLLALLAAAGALFVAGTVLQQFEHLVERLAIFPFWMVFELSLEALLYLLLAVVFSAVVASILPALRATGTLAASALHGVGIRSGPRLGRTWTVLVAVQAAMAMAAVPSAGPVVWRLVGPALFAPAFAVDQVLAGAPAFEDVRDPTAPRYTPWSSDDRFASVADEMVRRVTEIPGVDGVSFAGSGNFLPGFGNDGPIEIEGMNQVVRAVETWVDRRYFELFDARTLAGRAFEAGDADSGIAIVNRTFAERAFGARGAVGGRIRNASAAARPVTWLEIVGVVEDIDPARPTPQVFHTTNSGSQMIVRGQPAFLPEIAAEIREIAAALDPDLRVMGLRPVAESYRSRWLIESLLGAGLAVVVTVTALFSLAGVHTLVAFAEARGRREIGIRSALGAQPGRLVAGLFGKVLRPVAIGGVVGAVGATFLNAWLLESTTSIRTFLISIGVMLVLAALAVSGPARRVGRVDPADELRAG